MPTSHPLPPVEFLRQVEAALPQSSRTEQTRLLDHAWAWFTLSCSGTIPQTVRAKLTELESTYAISPRHPSLD